MKIHFLTADTPLTKTYTVAKDGTVQKTPYPNAYAFTSHEHDVPGIDVLHKLIVKYADQKGCLIKGELQRELKEESRAGSTSSEGATQWICLDIDKSTVFESPQKVLEALGMGEVSHIVQYSSSYGISANGESLDDRLSCHIFLMLDRPVAAPLLKQWLIGKNFSVAKLANDLALTASHNALHFALDVTTCQNDKLLYIAPPICKDGVKDTLGNRRIQLVKRKQPHYVFEDKIPAVAVNRQAIDERLNTLRAAEGLPARKKAQFKLDSKLGVEYLAKPDQAMVTGFKEDRGFIYLNLNGGDSWGYFFPVNAPEVVSNFKGEPNYLLRELAPSFYAEYTRKLKEQRRELITTSQTERKHDRKYLAFRDFSTGAYYNGWYIEENDELVLSAARSETQLRHFLAQYGQDLGDFVPDWNLIFDVSMAETIDFEKRIINQYKPSRFEYLEAREPRPTPTIDRLICHALGIDEENPTKSAVYEHFFNWVAGVVQLKRPMGTCWVLHGGQGTGKGLLFNRVLRPLLGESNTTVKRTEEFASNFNGWMVSNILVMVDEVHMSQLLQAKLVNSKLKNWVTEPVISVEEKYQPVRTVPNHNNFIFASNMLDPVHIDHNDRRFNVANYQPSRLNISDAELSKIDAELEDFFMRLINHNLDRDALRTPLNTDARKQMMLVSRSSIDVVSDAVNGGDLLWFFDQLPDDESLLHPFVATKLDQYKQVLSEWLDNTVEGRGSLTRDQLRAVCDYVIGNMPETAYKFTSMVKHHGLHIKQLSYRGRMVQGVVMRWQDLDKSVVALLRKRLA